MVKIIQVAMPIEKLELLNEENVVYNFSVREDESYVANNVVCHNCRCRSVPYVKELDDNTPKDAGDFNEWLNS